MGYVVMQKGMEPPSIDQMKAAFRGVPGLTPIDAPIMCRNSLGILVRGLELEAAQQLQANLAAQGVETEVADQATLPALPPLRHITKLECAPEGLSIFDPLGHSFLLEAKDVMLIAAGRVSVIEFKRTSAPAITPGQAGGLGIIDDLLFKNSGMPALGRPRTPYPEPDYQTTEEHHPKWIAEVVIRGGGLRYNIEADVSEDFGSVVRAICQSAPEAAVNRGAYYLREGNTEAFTYPSKSAFYDEMVWLLWRLKV